MSTDTRTEQQQPTDQPTTAKAGKRQKPPAYVETLYETRVHDGGRARVIETDDASVLAEKLNDALHEGFSLVHSSTLAVNDKLQHIATLVKH